MATPSLPDDFKEFLKLLDSNGVEYLLIARITYRYVRNKSQHSHSYR
jgi:hypothetical protein